MQQFTCRARASYAQIMGDKGSWGDRFAQRLTALPTGTKFVISLGLALSTIVPAGLIVSVVDRLLQSDDQTVHITCGDRDVERRFSREEYELKSRDLESFAVELCTT